MDVHAARIHGSADAVEYEVGHKIRLIENIYVSPGGEVSPPMLKAQLLIDLVL
jgi:hypothetical protein